MAKRSPSETQLGTSSATTIIVAEHESVVRWAIGTQLSEVGYKVLEAPSGPVALDLIRRHREAALLITDHRMPGMTGSQLVRQLRGLRPELPVIFISANLEEATESAAFYLRKPFTEEQLLLAVEGVIGGPETEKSA